MPYLIALVLVIGACGDAATEDGMEQGTPADSADMPVITSNPTPSFPASRDSSRPAGSLGNTVDATQVAARLSEYAITLSPDTIPAGETRLNIENRGERSHTVEIRHTTRGRWRPTPIAPGTTVAMSMALAPGTYDVVSTNDEYVSRGMKATLVVR
jgi:plastocyanin